MPPAFKKREALFLLNGPYLGPRESLGRPERELIHLRLDAAPFLVKGAWMLPSPLLAWAPDNKWLPTVQQSRSDTVRIVRISVDSGEAVHFHRGCVPGIAWTPDGHGLVVSSDRRGPTEIWIVPVDSESQPSLNVNDANPGEVAVSKAGQRLVFTHYSAMLISGELICAAADHRANPFIASTRYEARPSYSSDGNRIAFEWDRASLRVPVDARREIPLK